jgi:hypothetical protein
LAVLATEADYLPALLCRQTIGATAFVDIGPFYPVSNDLGRRLKLPGKGSRALPGSDQLDHPAPELLWVH